MSKREKEIIGLRELTGRHILSGVDMNTSEATKAYSPDSCAVNFVLDGVTYTALEDPDDGYRSLLLGVFKNITSVKYTFQPCQVVCSTASTSYDPNSPDILVMRDSVTGEIVLSVGTDYSEDYYPTFVYYWNPKNLVINRTKKRGY